MQKKLTLKEKKRADILEAAIEEFRQNGFPATSMDRISERAQVSKRTLYNHFSSKELLFKTIVKNMMNAALQAVNIPYKKGKSIRAQLKHIAESELKLVSSESFLDIARMAMAESVRSPELARQVTEEIESCGWGIVPWVNAAVADKQLKVADPEIAANQFMGLLKTFAFYPQIFYGQPSLKKAERAKILRSTLDIFLSYYSI